MRFARRFTESRLHSPHTQPEDIAEFHHRSRAIVKSGYVRRLEILRGYDVREQLHNISTPTLLLAGDRDHLIPSVAEGRYMSARLPNAELQILRGYGHICLINHDFDLMKTISPWLSRLVE